MKQKFIGLNRERANSTILGDFNTPFSIMYRSNRQKINKEIEDMHNTINQLDPTEHYKQQPQKYTVFSSAHGTFSKMDHMLHH